MSDSKILKLLKTHLFTSRSDYPSVIDKLNHSFDPEDILYLFYEDVMREKQDGLGRICQFLDIPPIELPARALNKKVNTTAPQVFAPDVRTRLAKFYEKDKRVLADLFGTLPPEW